MELLADERLGLGLVRRDEERLGLDAEPQRLAFAVEDDRELPPGQIADRLGVEVVADVARKRAREDDELRALREVVELLEEQLELLRPHGRAPLVDLGVGAAGRVDDRGRRPRLALDADEVVEDRLAREPLDDPRARRPPASPVATTGTPSAFRARATLIPLPPASGRPALARWRWPRWKFGTVIVRSNAALSVTVTIIWRRPQNGWRRLCTARRRTTLDGSRAPGGQPCGRRRASRIRAAGRSARSRPAETCPPPHRQGCRRIAVTRSVSGCPSRTTARSGAARRAAAPAPYGSRTGA